MNRLAGAAAILLALVVTEATVPTLFPLIVSVILVVSPLVCWSATVRLGRAYDFDQDDAHNGGPASSRMLEAAFYTGLFLSIASTVGAILGVVAVLRVSGLVAPTPQVFLIGIAYVMVLIPGPAVELLRVFRD